MPRTVTEKCGFNETPNEVNCRVLHKENAQLQVYIESLELKVANGKEQADQLVQQNLICKNSFKNLENNMRLLQAQKEVLDNRELNCQAASHNNFAIVEQQAATIESMRTQIETLREQLAKAKLEQ